LYLGNFIFPKISAEYAVVGISTTNQARATLAPVIAQMGFSATAGISIIPNTGHILLLLLAFPLIKHERD